MTAPIAPAPQKPFWLSAVHAADEKKAQDIRVLDLRDITSFTDFFVICTGASTRQNQAISDGIQLDLKKLGDTPVSVEGYGNAEWILMDYGDYLVHIFLDRARALYDLERLWRHAKQVEIPPAPAA
jgi:ribosome-associated protein